MDLKASYRACAHVTRREARNFYFAFLSLPRRERFSVYALYAFCREADDIVDAMGAVEEQRQALDHLRARLNAAGDGQPKSEQDLALEDTIQYFGVDPKDLDDVLTGMELDLTLHRIESATELDRYCYHAASAVGLATLPILNGGVPPTDEMRTAAIDLGLGMQYINILRDVREDLDRDRIYLPAERLRRFEVTIDDLRAGEITEPIRALLADHADRAAEILGRGRQLSASLPSGGRRCTRLLAELYGRVLERIRQANFDVFSSRIGLPRREKIGLLVGSLIGRGSGA